MWTADNPTPSDSRGMVFAACSSSSRATESAPPETAAQIRSPGWIVSRLKASRDGAADDAGDEDDEGEEERGIAIILNGAVLLGVSSAAQRRTGKGRVDRRVDR
jgi:hypothetical protein